MKCKNRGKMGELALKIDIRKTYDRNNWGYVKNRMKMICFHEKCVNWTDLCMYIVQYHVYAG